MHLLFLFLSLLTLNSPFASISAPEVAFPSLSPEGTVKMLGFPVLGVSCLPSDASPFSSPFSRLRAAVAAGSAASPSAAAAGRSVTLGSHESPVWGRWWWWCAAQGPPSPRRQRCRQGQAAGAESGSLCLAASQRGSSCGL